MSPASQNLSVIKPTLWTTFSPQKICWELTTIEGQTTSNWQAQVELIKASLQQLKKAGIVGIRLVIFPTELTQNGKQFHFEALEIMLTMCQKLHLMVDFCLGPLQYPFYPSIRIPDKIRDHIQTSQTVNKNTKLATYALEFLKLQLKKYSRDKRIRGFYLGNEWPDRGRVAGKEDIRIILSEEFMLTCARLIKKTTTKPILFNTNIDVAFPLKQKNTFRKLFEILENQARLGFDVYPSQETWKNVPLIKLKRLFSPYPHAYNSVCTLFEHHQLFFAEIEAQPWGNGKSWQHIISHAKEPHTAILGFKRDSLLQTMKHKLLPCQTQEISLWGADFWLSAEKMGIHWPLEQIQMISQFSSDVREGGR